MGYIKITDRCNMRCAHCCMSATARGRDMSMETYRAAVGLLADYGEDLTIGGGEPTLHPRFWEMLGYALGNFESEMILVVTNGSNEDISVALANMAKKGVLSAALSRDQYHDPKLVTGTTIQAFQKHRGSRGYDRDYTDLREIRNVEDYGNRVVATGRGKKIEGADKNRCACETLMVDPTGTVWLCGHMKHRVGDVHSGIELPDDFHDWGQRCSEWARREGLLPTHTRRETA